MATFSYSEYEFLDKIGLNSKEWSLDNVSKGSFDEPSFYVAVFNDRVDAFFEVPMNIIPELGDYISNNTIKNISISVGSCSNIEICIIE